MLSQIKTTANGDTALHLACESGQLETVKLLSCMRKCNQEAKNNHGRTPLHIAVIRCHPHVVRYLLNK